MLQTIMGTDRGEELHLIQQDTDIYEAIEKSEAGFAGVLAQ